VAGELPCHKVDEGELTITIMDAFPATRGHMLVITKEHRTDALEMTDAELAETNIQLRKAAAAAQKVTGCPAFNLLNNRGSLAGQMVFHAHFHVIPRYETDQFQLRFSKLQTNDEEKAALAAEIKGKL
jgi:histidine triad (HIT) family protein